MKQKQRGNVIVGIIIGIVLGLAAALAVAVYVTKVPVPFLNKGPSRSAEQDAAESRKNSCVMIPTPPPMSSIEAPAGASARTARSIRRVGASRRPRRYRRRSACAYRSSK